MLMLNEVQIFGRGGVGRTIHSPTRNSDYHVDDLCRRMAGGSECMSIRGDSIKENSLNN